MFLSRIAKLRKAMLDRKIDGVLLIGDPNRNYMSGFTGGQSFLVITLNKAIFITDSRFMEQAKEEVKNCEVIEYAGAFTDFLSKIVKDLKIHKLGFEEDLFSDSPYIVYKEKVSVEWIPLEGIVEKFRMIKEENEIKAIRKAAEIADHAFGHIIEFIKLGMTEKEVGLELELFIKKLGATSLAFPPIVASGIRSSLPHGIASDKVINDGEFLTLDFGCVFEAYCSDMTRTVVIGKPNKKMKEIYDVVFNAQQAVLKAIRPGITGTELDQIARNYITESGYSIYFGHGLGHGVGRMVHELPHINFQGIASLEEGMVITSEPGVYIPDFGGARIEDLILITKDGCEVLSKATRELICL